MSEESLKHKTATGLWWGGVSNGVQQLISILIGIFLARILDRGDYGLIGMLTIFSAIASTIINSGFSVALTNKKNATQKDYDTVFWFSVGVGLFLYIVLFFCAPLIARFYGHPELTSLSRVFFIGFFFSGLGTVPYTVMFKQMMVKKQAVINITALAISGIVSLICALLGYGYWALALSSVINISLASILRFFVTSWRPTFYFSLAPIKEMLPFSSKLFITNLFSQISGNFFPVLLGKLYHSEQVGDYTQGQKWMSFGHSFITGMFNLIAQPVLVEVNENKERQKNIVRKMIRFGAFISFPSMLGLAFVGKEFIEVAIGEKWLPSVLFLQLLCIWGAFGFLSVLYVNLLYSHKKSDWYMYGTIIVGILQLAVVISLHPLGIFSMLIAYISMNFLGLIIWQYMVRKLIGLGFWTVFKDIFPYLAITLFCFLMAWICTLKIENVHLLLVGKIFLGALFYILMMKISKSVIFQESMDFLRKKKIT